mgnify:CR=1 FL=1
MRKPSLNARSGIDRDEKARDRRIAASVAEQAAATPDVAESANAVNAAPEKPTLEADDFFALVEADTAQTRAEIVERPEKMWASVPCRLKKATSRPSLSNPPGALK